MVFGISAEEIASAVAGLVLFGAVIRQIAKGWAEGRAQSAQIGTNAAAMVTAVAIGFEKEQRDNLVLYIERIAKALEAIAGSQAGISKAQQIMADKKQADIDEKLDLVLERMDAAEAEQTKARPVSRPRRRRVTG